MTFQHDALENLNTVFVAFYNLVVNANGIADPKVRMAVAKEDSFKVVDFLGGIHGVYSCFGVGALKRDLV